MIPKQVCSTYTYDLIPDDVYDLTCPLIEVPPLRAAFVQTRTLVTRSRRAFFYSLGHLQTIYQWSKSPIFSAHFRPRPEAENVSLEQGGLGWPIPTRYLTGNSEAWGEG